MRIFALGNLPEAVYATVGGKASGLDLLLKNGFTVPPGFVITDLDALDEDAVYEAFDALKADKVSVRSSTRTAPPRPTPASMRLSCLWTARTWWKASKSAWIPWTPNGCRITPGASTLGKAP